MKLYLAFLVATLAAAATNGQGTIGQVVFANKVTGVLDAPVISAITGRGPGPEYTVQLFLVEPANSLRPLVPSSVFRPPGPGAATIADRYWEPKLIDVPGVPPGSPATFVVRTWRTSYGSYEGAIIDGFGNGFYGESAPFTVFVGGGLLPPANLIGLQGFVIDPFPEPRPILLGALGAALLFGRRLRNGAKKCA
jgi:hypothetical protein